MKRRHVAATLNCLILLEGCSLSQVITNTSLDYSQTLEAVTNNMLVTNILLARDEAPLHFTDLSQIRGSLQIQAQAQLSEPFGSEYTSTMHPRAAATGFLAGASNPTFDMVPLNTKEFTAGITAPIDVKNMLYYLNEDQPDSQRDKIVVRLLVQKIEFQAIDERGLPIYCDYMNSPELKSNMPPKCNDLVRSVFNIPDSKTRPSFDDMVPSLANIFYVKKGPIALGPDVSISGQDLLHNAGSFANPSLSIQRRGPGPKSPTKYYLARSSNEGVLCLGLELQDKASIDWQILRSATLSNPVDLAPGGKPEDVCTGRYPPREQSVSAPKVYLYLRSVEAIFKYLGRVLITNKDNPQIPFFLNEKNSSSTRFSVQYLGKNYYINNSSDRDKTLFVLSVINQLLNLYKSSSEISNTPAVQAVP